MDLVRIERTDEAVVNVQAGRKSLKTIGVGTG
jgi:hypothetical protein